MIELSFLKFKRYFLRAILLFCSLSIVFSSHAVGKSGLFSANETSSDSSEIYTKSIPSHWQDKSVIVLEQSLTEKYRLSDEMAQNIMKKRRVIKLFDKSALEDLSEFYFYRADNNKQISIDVELTIVKQNGKKIKVDLSDAVETNEKIPLFFESEYKSGNIRLMKIAVPNLEINDIIDYSIENTINIYNRSYNNERSLTVSYEFYPLVYHLNSSYPIVNQSLTIMIDKSFQATFKSLNGAPDLVEKEELALDEETDKPYYRVFELSDKNRAEYEEEYFTYSRRINPIIKFQALYIQDSSDKGKFLTGKGKKIKNNIKEKDVKRIISEKIENTRHSEFYKNLRKYVKKRCKNYSKQELLKQIYYEYRFLTQKKLYSHIEQRVIFNNVANDKYYTKDILSILIENAFNPQIVIAVPKHIGTIDDAIYENEFTMGIKVDDFYMFPCNNFTHFNEVPSSIAGTEVFLMKPATDKRSASMKRFVLPEVLPEDNILKNKMQVKINIQDKELDIERTQILKGYFRHDNNEVCFLSNNYFKDDEIIFDLYYNKRKDIWGSKKVLAERARREESIKNQYNTKQKEILELMLESDFDVGDYKRYRLKKDGRFDDSPELIYSEYFTAENLLLKTGDNYMLNVGKLIGQQFELSEEDLQRQNDIFQIFPRTIENSVNIAIPKGFKVSGIKTLNSSFENESCSFVSSYEIQKNQIVVTTKKKYKKCFDNKEKWPDYTKMLNTAEDFTKKTLLLIPRNISSQVGR